MRPAHSSHLRVLLGVVLAALLTSIAGCAAEGHARDMEIARLYREGHCERVCLWDLLPYFQQRVGTMSVAELKRLLGEPRLVTPDGCWYRDALSCVYGWGHINDPDNDHPTGKHDQVLVYGEQGPPEHHIADESVSLWFTIKHGTVIGVWMLAP